MERRMCYMIRGKNQQTETNQEITEMLELSHKDINTIIRNISKITKENWKRELEYIKYKGSRAKKYGIQNEKNSPDQLKGKMRYCIIKDQ